MLEEASVSVSDATKVTTRMLMEGLTVGAGERLISQNPMVSHSRSSSRNSDSSDEWKNS
jgi:hypothetical protein